MASPRLIAVILVLMAALAASPGYAAGTDQNEFVAAGAKKLSPKQLKELFSDSRFITRDFTVRNFADGSRVFKAGGFSAQLRWWIDGSGQFCTDTRSGMELCGIEYYLRKDKLRIFTRAGETVQEFTVK